MEQAGVGPGDEDIAVGLGVRALEDHVGGQLRRQLLLRDAHPDILQDAVEGPAGDLTGGAQILDLLGRLHAAERLDHALRGDQLRVRRRLEGPVFVEAQRVRLEGYAVELLLLQDLRHGLRHTAPGGAPVDYGEVRRFDPRLLGIARVRDQKAALPGHEHVGIRALEAACPADIGPLLEKDRLRGALAEPRQEPFIVHNLCAPSFFLYMGPSGLPGCLRRGPGASVPHYNTAPAQNPQFFFSCGRLSM